MITKWKLFNFKSIKKETELEFLPLTILAGANSCGKSTMLQSILLISQTLSSRGGSESVVLNSNLVKLGQFNDIKSFKSTSDQILIGWECKPYKGGSAHFPSTDLRRPLEDYLDWESDLKFVKAELAFDAKVSIKTKELTQLHPILFSFNLSAISVSEDKIDLKSEFSVVKGDYERNATDEIDSSIEQKDLILDVAMDDTSKKDAIHGFASAECVGCRLFHFLPTSLALRFDVAKQEAHHVIQTIFENNFRRTGRRREFNTNPEIPLEVIDVLRAAFGEHDKILDKITSKRSTLLTEKKITLDDLIDAFRKLRIPQRRNILRSLESKEGIQEKIKDVIIANRDQKSRIVSVNAPHQIVRPAQYVYTLFTQRLKYLGPLRDEPRSLYPFVANIEPNDIGLKGEYTAAVLDINKDKRVRYISPESFDDPLKGVQISSRTLLAAVINWLKYLGIAETVETHDKGKHGHELKITTHGTNEPQDLTHVGVGVSQVLPILVICLLADSDTTIIIEQPELHLHPMVQTRLADFFICMARLGVQCIVETHSEHIVNRLRARIAEDPQNTLCNLAKIYFGEKVDGQTQFREVEVNKYGAIHDWPKNFFDQSQRETEKILRSALEKKKSEKQGDSANE